MDSSDIKYLLNIDITEFLTGNYKNLIESSIQRAFAFFNLDVTALILKEENLNQLKQFNFNKFKITKSQIDNKTSFINYFWGKVKKSDENCNRELFNAFIYYFFFRSGSIISEISNPHYNLLRFFSKCFDFSLIEHPEIKILIIKGIKNNSKSLQSKIFGFGLYQDCTLNNFTDSATYLVKFEDVYNFIYKISSYQRKNLKETQKVYATLKQIGNPAQINEIRDIHNKIFQDDQRSFEEIYLNLEKGEHGILNIGDQVFSLKEWKTKPLSFREAVAKIVSDKFKVSKRPVPYAIITAEIWKYRQMVNPNSLRHATLNNPKIEKIIKDFFAPKKEDKQLKEKISPEKLDDILRKLEEKEEKIKSKSTDYFAIIKCEKCGKSNSEIYSKHYKIYLKCTKCNYDRLYPSGKWGIKTNISCPKCKNDFIIGFHQKYGPYLKCKKCEHWDQIRFFLNKGD